MANFRTIFACLLFVEVLITPAFSQNGVPRILINSMGHSAKVQDLLFTPDGTRIISVAEDKTIRVWDALKGEMIKKFESQIGDGPDGMLYSSAISPNGKLLAIGGYPVNGEIYIFIIDLAKGEQVAIAQGHSNVVNSLGFTSNGKYLVSGSDDGTVKVWPVTNDAEYTASLTLTLGSAVKNLSVNPITMDLAIAAEGKKDIIIFNLAELEKGASKLKPRYIQKHKGGINKVVYSHDGNYLASSSKTNEFFLWKTEGTVLKEFVSDNIINAIAFSYDSKILVGLDVAGKGVSYGIPGGNKQTEFTGHDNTVFSTAFSPSESGSYIVASAGGNNNEIFLWNPINGRTIKKIKGKGNSIQDMAFGNGLELFISHQIVPEGKKTDYKMSFDLSTMKLNLSPDPYNPPARDLNSGLTQSSEIILDLPKGKSVQNDPSVDGRILDYQMTADGSVIVASDYSLKMYDRNGLLMKEFVGHSGGVRAITISTDGRYMATGGEDQTIILWKLSETGAAPSLRQHPEFNTENWSKYFASLPIDSLTKEPSKKAWKEVIDFLKLNGDKNYKGIEEVYKNLGESQLPFATLFLSEDNEWVCWTPKGYFTCTSAGSNYFGWHINRGITKLADYFAADQYFEILYRPKEMEKSIAQAKRVEDIIKEEGGRIFDLSKLHKPSAGFFNTLSLTESNKLHYQNGDLVTTEKALPLDVEIYDGGGGIKEVNIYQNDKLIVNDQEVKSTADRQKILKTYTVDLTNETNEFKIVVINYQKIESTPQILKMQYVGEVMTTASLHLLVVGINKYQNSAYNLNYAQPDAQSFTEKLIEQTQRIYKTVEKVEIYDERATKKNIMDGFKSIAAKAKPEDVFIFFYAGHGSLDEDHKDKDGDSPFYFVPTDVTKLYGDAQQLQTKGLSGSELQENLLKIKATKQLVLMDACHSGAALKSMNVRAVGSDEKAIRQLARSSGVVCIASSGSKQFATEFETLKHGVFTYALLEALSGKGDNGDNKVTVNELKFYMDDRVPELTKQYGGLAQYPTGFINGSDFPIIVFEKPEGQN